MSNSFNNSKKCVMQQSLHITAKYTTSLAETLLFILVTLYRLSILFQCHLFIYLLILYIDYHTIESNMNHGYKTNFPWKKKSWGNKSYPWMCIQKSFSQFQIIFILPWSITADMLSLQKEQTDLYKNLKVTLTAIGLSLHMGLCQMPVNWTYWEKETRCPIKADNHVQIPPASLTTQSWG